MRPARTLFERYRIDILLVAVVLTVALFAAWLAYYGMRTSTLTMATPPAVLPRSGLHDLERFPNNAGFFRWSTANSTLQPANPGGFVRLSFRLLGGPNGLTPVQFAAEGRRFAFEARPEPRIYRMLLPQAQSERLKLDVSAPTVEIKNRDLGVVFADLRVQGGGAIPLQIIPALLGATVGIYCLFRQARIAPLSSAAITLAILVIIVAWQRGGGWVYGLLLPMLMLITAGSIAALVLDRWRSPGQPAPLEAGIPDTRSWLPVVALLALALIARLPWIAAPDPVGDLELAARRMSYLNSQGLAGSYTRGGDYLPLRLIILYGLSFFVRPLGGDFFSPLPPVTLLLVKLPQLLADLATIAILYLWGRHYAPRWAWVVAALYSIAPPVWINVAWWGQVDALLMLPLIGAILLLDQGNGRWSWLCWAAALLIKAQAIVFAPILFLVTLRKHGSRGLVESALAALALFVAGCATIVAAGQGFGLAEAYLGSVGRFPRVTYGAYNLWHLALQGHFAEDSERVFGLLSYRQIGLALLASVALLVCGSLWRHNNGPARMRGAAILALAFFTLPTQIHERYLFLALPFLAFYCIVQPRFMIAFVLLAISATLNILGVLDGFVPELRDPIEDSALPYILAILNLFTLLVLLGWNPSLPSQKANGER